MREPEGADPRPNAAGALGGVEIHYLANLRSSWQEVSHADPTAFVWDAPAPVFVLTPAFIPFSQLSETVSLVVPGLWFDSQRGDGYVVGPDGRLIRAPAQTVSRLLPFTGTLAAGPGSYCLQPGRLSELALSYSRTLPKGDRIVNIHSVTRGDATVLLGTDVIPIKGGARTVTSSATTAGPTREIVLRTPARAPICLQLTVEQPVRTGPPRG